MKEKQDYKAWYYVPVSKAPMEMKEKFIEDSKKSYDSKFTKQTRWDYLNTKLNL